MGCIAPGAESVVGKLGERSVLSVGFGWDVTMNTRGAWGLETHRAQAYYGL